MLISLTYLAVFVGTVFQHWPFRVRFLIHQISLDQLADELEHRREIAVPLEVGTFKIVGAELKNFGEGPMPCLWTDLNPSGYSGFIRCTSEESRRAALIYRGLTEQVSERWLFIVED